MTTIISTTKIPCRAKDPHTCKYHSAELRAETALRAGDIDGYLVAEAEKTAAIKTTPEVIDFFAAKNAAGVISGPPRGLTANLLAAETSLPNRLDAYLQQAPGFRYTVGGKPEDITNETYTTARTVYQSTAEHILDMINRDDPTAGIPRERLERALDQAREDHLDDANDDLAEPTFHDEVVAAHAYTRQRLLNTFTSPIAPGGKVGKVNPERLLRTLDIDYWQQPAPTATVNQLPARQRGFQAADLTRHNRIDNHFNGGTPYLVGGTANNVETTEFTAARLVYQRAANLLLDNAKYRKADGFDGYVVNINDFERDYRTLSDKTATELGLNDLASEAEINETHRTVEQVYRTLGGHFQKAPYGERTAALNRGLRSLDLAFWNSPNGPANNR